MDQKPYKAPRLEAIPRPWRLRVVVLLVVFLVLAVLAWLFREPLVELAQANRQWILVIGGFFVVASIAVYLQPDACAERRYKAELAAREPINDQDLFADYFKDERMAEDIPGKVRRIFANEMDYPAEKMLPDDDMWFYFNEIDAIYVVREAEKVFGIEIASKDFEHSEPTIRSFSHLVQRTRGQETSGSDSASPTSSPLNHEGPLADDNPYRAPQTPLAKAQWERGEPRNLPPWLSALALAALATIPIAIALWVGH